MRHIHSVKKLLSSGKSTQLRRLTQFSRQLTELSALTQSCLPSPWQGQCQAVNIRGKTLILQTESPAWASQLRFYAPAMLSTLTHHHCNYIKEISIRIKPVSALTPADTRQKMNISSDVFKSVYCNKEYVTMNDNRALKWVSRNGHLQLVIHLVRKGDISNCKWHLPTRYAARNGHLKIVSYLISKGFCCGVNVNVDIVLRDAAKYGQFDIVKYIINNYKIKISCHFNCNKTLSFAFREGHINIVKYLVTKGQNINELDIWSIKCAITNGHYSVIQYIFDRNINTFNIHEEYINLAFKYNSSKILKLLCSKLRGQIHIDKQIFDSAVINGHFEVLKYYFDCNTSSSIEFNHTFLELASRKSNYEIIDYIISRGWKLTITAKNLWDFYMNIFRSNTLFDYILNMITKYNVCPNHHMLDIISVYKGKNYAAYCLVVNDYNIIVHKGKLVISK